MARTYLSPAMSRDNLKVVTDAPTIRVVFNKASSKGSAATAAGVEFRAGGATHSAELAAGGEVLLCAGTIHSPWLLQRSGVGAAQLLREHSVDVVADSPGVGQGLQDHPGVVLAARMSEEHNGMTATGQVYGKRGNISLKALFQYVWNKTGPLTTTGCDHGAFVRTSASHAEPDLQMRFVPGFSLDPDGVNSYAMFGELKKRGLSWPAGVTIQLLACRPRSRGSVRLASSDALAPPSIDINYFSAQEDMDTLVAGLTKAREVMAQRPLAQYVTEEVYPGPANSSVEQLQAYVRKTVHSGNALVGTCRMGASAADGSVVSSDSFKVHGVEGVRVVDASVIPRIPGGQTGAATVMVAERAASLLAKGTPIRGASGSSAPSAPVPAMA